MSKSTINAGNQGPTATYHKICQRYPRPLCFESDPTTGDCTLRGIWNLFGEDRFRLPPSSGVDIVLNRANDEHNVVSEPQDIFKDFRCCAFVRTGGIKRYTIFEPGDVARKLASAF
jgi:hypothetical protein